MANNRAHAQQQQQMQMQQQQQQLAAAQAEADRAKAEAEQAKAGYVAKPILWFHFFVCFIIITHAKPKAGDVSNRVYG